MDRAGRVACAQSSSSWGCSFCGLVKLVVKRPALAGAREQPAVGALLRGSAARKAPRRFFRSLFLLCWAPQPPSLALPQRPGACSCNSSVFSHTGAPLQGGRGKIGAFPRDSSALQPHLTGFIGFKAGALPRVFVAVVGCC